MLITPMLFPIIKKLNSEPNISLPRIRQQLYCVINSKNERAPIKMQLILNNTSN